MYKIGFDLDGCVVNFIDRYLHMLNKKFNIPASMDQIDDYDSIKNIIELSDNEYIKIIDSVITDWKKLPLYPGSKKFIEKYYRNTGEINYVTARNCRVEGPTRRFIESKIGTPYSIYFGNNKVDYCLKNNINIMVEDNIDNSLKLASNKIVVLLMKRPWNRKWLNECWKTDQKFIIPVDDWEMISMIYGNLIGVNKWQ